MRHETRGRLTKDGIRIYDPADFAGMHAAGALAASILDAMSDQVFPGQTTGKIDEIITQMVDRTPPLPKVRPGSVCRFSVNIWRRNVRPTFG